MRACVILLFYKEYVVLRVKRASHLSTIALKPFNRGTKLQLLPQHYEPEIP